MKKFLSILLALAVGFTFTFGSAMSAFGATTEYDTYYAKVDAAAKQVKDQFELNYTSAVNSYTAGAFTDSATNTYNIGVDAFKAAAAKYHEDVIEYIDNKTIEVKADYTNHNTKSISELVALYNVSGTKVPAKADAVTATIKNDSSAYTWDANYKYVDAAARAQFDETKADALKHIVALVNEYDATVRDITVYVNSAISGSATFNAAYVGNLTLKTSHYDLAAAEQTRLEKEVTNVTIGTKATLKEASDAATEITGITANIAQKPGTTTGEYIFKLNPAITVTGVGSIQNDVIYLNGDVNKIVALKTSEALGNEEITDKATKESVKGLLASKSAAIYKENVDEKTAGTINATEFANSEKVREALVTAYTFLIDNDKDGVTPSDVQDYLNQISVLGTWVGNAKTLTGEYKELVDNVANIKALEEYAAKYKVAGYDAEAIDKIVDEAKARAYKATIAANALTTVNDFNDSALTAAKKSIEEANDTDLELEFNKAAYIAGLEDLKAKVADTYYEKEAAELVALIDTHIPNIKAAADDNAFAVAKNNYEVAKAKINDMTAVKSAISGYVNKAMTTLTAYEGLLNAGKKDAEKINIRNINWQDFFAAKGARTQAEVDALIADAKAKIDTLKTAADLKTEKEAVEALVKAIPAVVKADSEATIKAAWEANKAYVENNGEYVTPIYNKAALDAAVTALHNLNKAALSKEIAKLPAASAVKLTDKAAVMAAYDKAVALNDATAEVGGMFEGESAFTMTTINGLYDAVRTLDKNAAIAKVNAIPVEVKLADKATIEAARAACDEFIKEYTDYDNNYNAAKQLEVVMKDLTAAEKKLAELEDANKFTDADAKAYVFDQVAKATSVKLGAKKVKVTANFDASKLVENGYTVEYKFYKSTKKSSGYKYTGVTKVEDAKTYTNTNAKKGKNYYKFKIVVKNADGTVILTTALKDCKYACRTIK